MADNSDALWAKMQRTMDFILEQQAGFSVRQGQFDERQAEFASRQAEFEERTRRAMELHERAMAAIDRRLSRAIKLGVREVRNERKRRQERDAEWDERMRRLDGKIEAFIDSMRKGGNGSGNQT